MDGWQEVCCNVDFNPRSREGSDSPRPYIARQVSNFNPRSREGSDALTRAEEQIVRISIHAPAKGATAKITKTIPNDFAK